MIATVFHRGRSQRLELQAFLFLGFLEDGTAVGTSTRTGKVPSAQVSRGKAGSCYDQQFSIAAAAIQGQSDGL